MRQGAVTVRRTKLGLPAFIQPRNFTSGITGALCNHALRDLLSFEPSKGLDTVLEGSGGLS